MAIQITGVDYYLPESVLTNDDLSEEFPEWSVDKISAKTGIRVRHIAAADEYSSDLACAAVEKLFAQTGRDRSAVDFLIVCSQTPDYVFPALASTVQTRVGLGTSAGAIDLNLGCSGFVYALSMAKGMIESGQARCVLLVTADTYSKLLNPADKSVRTIFGDGATASLVELRTDSEPDGFHSVFGTDGSGAKDLITPRGGIRDASVAYPATEAGQRGLEPSRYDLYMNGPEIFNFTLRVVPSAVEELLSKAGMALEDIDLFVFHQANAFMLEHLRRKIGVPQERFFISMADSGNTVSSTIPIALTEAVRQRQLRPGMRVMLLGFGVGLSWGGAVMNW